MKIDYLYAAVFVKDIPSSQAFYARILGRAPDDKPMETLVQWRGFNNAGIQLFEDPAKSGKGIMTIVVADVEKIRSSLDEMGIALAETQHGDFGRIARLTDPDGNVIVFAEPPKRSIRKA